MVSLNGHEIRSYATKNKNFHYYCALQEKFFLDQGSCASAASIR